MALNVFNTKVAQSCATPLKVKREMGPAAMMWVNSRKVQDVVATGQWVDHKNSQRQTKGKEIGALVELLGRHLRLAGANSKKAKRTCLCVFIFLGRFPGMHFLDVTEIDVLHSSPGIPKQM